MGSTLRTSAAVAALLALAPSGCQPAVGPLTTGSPAAAPSPSTSGFAAIILAAVEDSTGTVLDTVLAARLADGDTRTAYLAKRGRNSQQRPVAGRIQASGPRLAADVEERRKEAPTRIEQAGKALAEPFKHADALKTTKAETARIDQLMAEATKSAKQPTEHYTPEATAHQPAPDTTGRPANPNQRGTTTSSGEGPSVDAVALRPPMASGRNNAAMPGAHDILDAIALSTSQPSSAS